jgi:polyisoprenyl-phosphate glycosyltransferase
VLTPVAVVVPVYGNAPTLAELAGRIAAALHDRPWTLRFVVDASPDDSLAVVADLAAADPRLSVTALTRNVGQNRALLAGLAAEPRAGAWVCLDADLQDPPEAVPALLERLARGDVGAVFAGRRGAYESAARRLTGMVHRAAMARLTGLPADAGAFVAMDASTRDALLAGSPPGIVAGIGAAGVRCTSVPVVRAARATGRSAWTPAARVRQSAHSLVWLWRATRPSSRPSWRSPEPSWPARPPSSPPAVPAASQVPPAAPADAGPRRPRARAG